MHKMKKVIIVISCIFMGNAIAMEAGDLADEFSALFAPLPPKNEITPETVGRFLLEIAQQEMRGKQDRLSNVISFKIHQPNFWSNDEKIVKIRTFYNFLNELSKTSLTGIKKEESISFIDNLNAITSVKWAFSSCSKEYYVGDDRETNYWLSVSGERIIH